MKKSGSPKTLLNYDSIRNLPRTALYDDCVFDTTIESSRVSHVIRRAWKELDLTAALVVDNQPTVYFVEVRNKDLEKETELHRKLWNQGTANILLVADPAEVRIYSAFVPPTKNTISENDKNDQRLINSLGLSAFILQDFAIQVTTGTYYRERPTYFNSKNGVDSSLLENLKAAAKKLKKVKPRLDSKQAHSLIGRLLFLFYLWDRRIIKQNTFQKKLGFSADMDLRQYIAGKDISAEIARQRLLSIFKKIQYIFNGSLFGDDLEKSEKEINADHVEILQQLITGEIEIETGQCCLFPMYNFEMIPIETISSIYENFLLAENPDDKKNQGAFYTPRYLAELTVDVATEGWATLQRKKYLDPACGSGIFLVILFNRMAEEWRSRNKRAKPQTRMFAFRDFLTENLHGVDVNETAAQITCFSLYLAFLDQMEPNDVVELQELLDMRNKRAGNEKKPKEKILPKLIGKTIFPANFFAEDLPLTESFDLVIGNPPWTGREHPIDKELISWINSERRCPYVEKYGTNQTAKTAAFTPTKQSVTGFLWKSLCHLLDSANACLLIPTKTLTNKNMSDFQKAWLLESTVERIVQLADFSFILFEKADCPATVIRFSRGKPTEDHLIVHDTPKVERNDPRQSFIVIHTEDRKTISQEDMRDAAERDRIGSAWKQLFWGTNRDHRFLARLESFATRTIQNVIDERGWVSEIGFMPFYQEKYDADPKKYREPIPRTVSDSCKFIDARFLSHIDLVATSSDASPIGNRYRQLRRNPNPQIYESPLILVNQGFTKFVYFDFPVLFRSSLLSISCGRQQNDRDLLLFLCGILNTPLAQYYCFHNSSSQGVERDKVEPYELKRFPFPLPNDFSNPSEKWKNVRRVVDCILGAKKTLEKDDNLLQRKSFVRNVKQKIKESVYEYYEIAQWEEKLIEDTVSIFAKSATPGSLDNKKLYTLVSTTREHRESYAELLCKLINTWCRRAPFKVSASVQVACELGQGLLVLVKSDTKEKYGETNASNSKIAKLLQIIQQSLLTEPDSYLAMQRRYVHFEQDRMYMIKPLELRHWTQTAALNDADEIYAAMFNAKFGEGV